MNNKDLNFTNNNIGIDPLTVEIIDNLDSDTKEVKEKKKSSKEKKPKKFFELLKAILFTIFLILLMIGISYGLYYYLKLGNKKKENVEFVLENKNIFIGEAISDNIYDYGDFNNIDVSKCTLDVSLVDNTKVGEYDYSVMCDGAKYSAKFKVSEKSYFSLSTNVVYKKQNENILATEFAFSNESYSYTFANDVSTSSVGGPYFAQIDVKDVLGNVETIYGIYYVINDNISYNLICQSNENNLENVKYYILDNFIFDAGKKHLGYAYRKYEISVDTKEEYYNYIYSATKGKLTVGKITGYLLRNDVNKKITLITDLNQNALNLEYQSSFPDYYNDIESYYKNIKNYSCQ